MQLPRPRLRAFIARPGGGVATYVLYDCFFIAFTRSMQRCLAQLQTTTYPTVSQKPTKERKMKQGEEAHANRIPKKRKLVFIWIPRLTVPRSPEYAALTKSPKDNAVCMQGTSCHQAFRVGQLPTPAG